VTGTGFLTGAMVRARFRPAPPSTGVVFVRGDLDRNVQIPAAIDRVSGTDRRTTLGHPPADVGLVEHVLAALAGLRIDNCFIELNAGEPPGVDGSARPFVDALRKAGSLLQPARRKIYGVLQPVLLSQPGATLAIYPPSTDDLKITYILNYGAFSPIDRQIHTQIVTPEAFANSIAGCRTFLLDSEAAELRRQGLGTATSPKDLLVFGQRGPIQNKVRYANEPARHKILDLVGDLSLFGHDLRGHVVAYRSGHSLNIELVRALTAQLGRRSTRTHDMAA
jgi:UDP-3-O-acyl N-acetylglucosamine deacetylase